MRYNVRRFKSLKIAIKELEPYIKNGEHLQRGKPFKRFHGLRSRELLANWLICVSLNFFYKSDRWSFFSDPNGGDGIIVDSFENETWATEHVMVPRVEASDVEDIEESILEKIEGKKNKGGLAYASGKTLIVFLNVNNGSWSPDRVAKKLLEPLYFDEVWVVGLQAVKDGIYSCNVAQLVLNSDCCAVVRVHISSNFDDWWVELIQVRRPYLITHGRPAFGAISNVKLQTKATGRP